MAKDGQEYLLIDFKTSAGKLPLCKLENFSINITTKYLCQARAYLAGLEKKHSIRIDRVALFVMTDDGKIHIVEKKREELDLHWELFQQAAENFYLYSSC